MFSETAAALHLMLCKHLGPYTLSGQVILLPLPAVVACRSCLPFMADIGEMQESAALPPLMSIRS